MNKLHGPYGCYVVAPVDEPYLYNENVIMTPLNDVPTILDAYTSMKSV
ncbi:MAG: hypothetical protein JXX29_13200 [Deltaproteobacteria bacterium]|nr:hypothetical protein [Deltaproteobacteria bacterium]MBN2672635.1 hypothetical protein [Deltaproteobacteria bacterium]